MLIFLKENILRLSFILFLSFIIVFLGLRIFIAQPMAGFLADDAYFYAQIAYNVAVNHISSFDGINVTNGYHFLWCWILSLISFLISMFTLDKMLHLHFMLIAYFVIILSVIYYYYNDWLERLIVFCLIVFSTLLTESGLLTLLLIIYINKFTIKEPRPLVKRAFLEAFLTIAIIFTRIDSIIILLLLNAINVYNKSYKLLSFKLTTIFSSLLCQIITCKLLFGNYFTVSSLIKANSDRAFSFKVIVYSNIINNGARLSILILLFIIFLLSLRLKKDKEIMSKIIIAVAVLSFPVFHLFWNVGLQAWYFIPSYAVLAWLIFKENEPSLIKRRIIKIAVFLLALLFVLNKTNRILNFSKETKYANYFLQQLKYKVPKNEPVYQIDGSGYIGYMSERRIINGDGLVNSYNYYYQLIKNDLRNYLKNNHIKYVILNQYPTSEKLIDFSGLILYKKDTVQIISPPIGLKKYCPFALYKIKASIYEKHTLP